MKYRVLVLPKAPETALFGDLTNITTMAYVPVEWDLTGENGRARSRRCLRTLRVRLAPNLPSEAKLLRCMSEPQSQASGSQISVDAGGSAIRPYQAALPGAGADGLTYFAAISLKVTPNGAVTATLTYDTGKKKKGKAVIYKPTCSTVVIPTSAADANPFTGEVPLYFASSPANNFPGFTIPAPL